jgi:hypothetical protein
MLDGEMRISRWRRQPVILLLRNTFASATSVSLFPRDRMRDITSERLALVKMSAITILFYLFSGQKRFHLHRE